MKSIIKLFIFISLCFASYSKTITVGTHYSPPWSDGKCFGAEIDIIKESFSYSNIKVQCKYFSYARLVRSFINKEIDFASPITKFDGDVVKAFYSDNFIPYVDVALGLKNQTISVNDLSQYNIVAYQGAKNYLGDKYVSAVSKSPSYFETSDRDSQLEMLKSHRVELIVGEKNIMINLASKIIKKDVYTNVVLKKWDIRAASYDKELIESFNKGLRIMKKKNRIKEIFKKFNIIH